MMNFIVNTVHGLGFTRIFTTERYALRQEDYQAVQDQGRTMLNGYFTLIAQHLSKRAGYVFDTFSIADAALFYVEFWADRIGLELPAECEAHLKLMRARPVVKQVLMEEGYYR